jgi:glycosyltransferase involved in cell wall biosynthesis
MAAGVPVISTNAGGLPEININGKTGFLSPVGNVKEMSSNAITLLQDDNVLEHFKKNAREQADKFDITNVVPQYEALYDRFLNKGSAVELEKTKIA